MKKVYLAIIAFILHLYTCGRAEAQTCTPDPTLTTGGVKPTAAAMPCIYRNVPYNSGVTIMVPDSFDSPYGKAKIDSVEFTSVTHPNVTGIGHKFYQDDSTINGGQRTCLNFFGSTSSPVGNDTVRFVGFAHISAFGMPFKVPVDNGTLNQTGIYIVLKVVNTQAECSIASPVKNINANLTKFSISPNPLITKSNISFDLEKPGPVTVSLINILGKEVFKEEILGKSGENYYSLLRNNYPQGLYMLNLNSAGKQISKKILITD